MLVVTHCLVSKSAVIQTGNKETSKRKPQSNCSSRYCSCIMFLRWRLPVKFSNSMGLLMIMMGKSVSKLLFKQHSFTTNHTYITYTINIKPMRHTWKASLNQMQFHSFFFINKLITSWLLEIYQFHVEKIAMPPFSSVDKIVDSSAKICIQKASLCREIVPGLCLKLPSYRICY